MKTINRVNDFSKKSIQLVLVTIAFFSLNVSGVPVTTTKKFTLKNNSGANANDIHFMVSGINKIYSASVDSLKFNPDSKAFNSPYPNKVEWDSAENISSIPVGGTIEIVVQSDHHFRPLKDSCYLTLNGVMLFATGLIDVKSDVVDKTSNSGKIKFKNYESYSVTLTNVVAHVDNSSNPVSTSLYNPSGSIVPGIPSTFTLGPGDSIQYSFTFSNPYFFISSYFKVANSSTPGDQYLYEHSELQSVTAIPTLSQWGLIIFSLLLLSLGMVLMYRKKYALVLAGINTQSEKYSLFDKRLYVKVLGLILLTGVSGLALSFWYFGEVTKTDTFGTLISSGIVAYMAHLFIIMKRNK